MPIFAAISKRKWEVVAQMLRFLSNDVPGRNHCRTTVPDSIN